jgi:hypothetical protein
MKFRDAVYSAEDTGVISAENPLIYIYLGNTPAAHKQMLRIGNRQYAGKI